MSEAGILKVVEERPTRGTTERVYAIAPEKAMLSAEDFETLTSEEHERMFSTFTAMLLSQFHNYAQQPDIDLVKDGVGYRTIPLSLSDAEFAELMHEFGAMLKKRLENPASAERRRRLFSFVVMPDVHSE